MGRAPIHPVPFLIAKLALVAVIVAGVSIRRPLPALAPLAVVLAIAALVVLFVAMHDLGVSGVTSSVFRIASNPEN